MSEGCARLCHFQFRIALFRVGQKFNAFPLTPALSLGRNDAVDVWWCCGLKVVFDMKKPTQPHTGSTHQTVMEISTAKSTQSIRIGFTDQRLTAHGGLAFWSALLHKRRVRQQLERTLPHTPTSPNAYAPADLALSFLGGILAGADKLARVAYLGHDPAIAQVLGVEAIPSQSSLSRFFSVFNQSASDQLNGLHASTLGVLPSRKEGYTLDLDSWSLLPEDGHQEGVAVGHTRAGLKPCHRPLIACLGEAKLVAGFWLRRGDAQCAHQASRFLGELLDRMPKHIRITGARADSGFYHEEFLSACESRGLRYVVVARLYEKWQRYCRHEDAAWTPTEVPGLDVQEIAGTVPGRRTIILRHRLSERGEVGGKNLIEVPGFRFQALVTNLPETRSAVAVWRFYNGRADSENRIKELGGQFGVRGLCCRKFWATEAACHLAIWAYNLCVLPQRELGLLEKMQLVSLRWRLFGRAAVWSRAQGKPTLKLAVKRKDRAWWEQVVQKLNSSLPPLNCYAVEFAPL